MTTPFPGNDPARDPADEPIDYHLVDPVDAADFGCAFCLGGFVPAGSRPILGLVYQACPHCCEHCRCCNGLGLFPADTTCIHCLTEALAVYRYTAVFCHTCAGVIAVRPTDQEVTP
jgi:hypothetical protein